MNMYTCMYLLCFEIAIISLNNSLRGNKSFSVDIFSDHQ